MLITYGIAFIIWKDEIKLTSSNRCISYLSNRSFTVDFLQFYRYFQEQKAVRVLRLWSGDPWRLLAVSSDKILHFGGSSGSRRNGAANLLKVGKITALGGRIHLSAGDALCCSGERWSGLAVHALSLPADYVWKKSWFHRLWKTPPVVCPVSILLCMDYFVLLF